MAVALSWDSSVELDLQLHEFLAGSRTLSVYVMPQFPHGTAAPVLASRPNGSTPAGWFRFGLADFAPPPPAACAGPDRHTPQNSGASEYLVDVERWTEKSQDGWRLCLNCQLLWFTGNGPGACAAGGGHRAWESVPYRLLRDLGPADLQAAGKVQDGWRWCRRCQTLTWPDAAGACAAGGIPHDTGASARYALRQRPVSTESGLHAGWNWCPQCAGLHFGGIGTGVLLAVGSSRRTYPVPLRRGQWHHLALVTHSAHATVYVDGRPAGPPLPLPAPVPPEGTVRLGRTDLSRVTGTDQFCGLVDDLALFDVALPEVSVASLARRVGPLTGEENALLAGWPLSAGPHPAALRRPAVLGGRATPVQIGPQRDSAADAARLPVPTPAVPIRLPFPAGEVWGCGQSVDDPNGTHRGSASFCYDFFRITPPGSDGAPFVAPASGVVIDVTWSGRAGGAGNELALATAPDEFVGFSHHRFGSPAVELGETVVAGTQLALTGNTGTGSPHLHVGLVSVGGRVIPSAFSGYEVSRDEGKTWTGVVLGSPAPGEWVRIPVAPAPQAGWRWCSRCGCLFRPDAGNRCFAGSAHDGTASGDYTLVQDPSVVGQQAAWCRRCGVLRGLAFGGLGSACPAGDGHDPGDGRRYLLTRGGAGQQPGWRLCRRCGALHFVHPGHASRCSTGGAHDTVTPAEYTVVVDAGSTPYGEDGWKRCGKCRGLYFGPAGSGGVCPAAGPHTAGPNPPRYQLLRDLAPSLPQPGWRRCGRCQGLFHGGGGTCPAGGPHDPAGSADYRVLTAGPQAGEQDWRWCSRCQGLFRGPGAGGVCPAGGAHDPSSSGSYRFDPLVQLF